MNRRRWGGVGLSVVLATCVAACAHTPPGARAGGGDAPAAQGRPASASPAGTAPYRPCRTRTCVGGDPRRRQYFDERRSRYYFFDPSRKRYYWEDGTPRA